MAISCEPFLQIHDQIQVQKRATHLVATVSDLWLFASVCAATFRHFRLLDIEEEIYLFTLDDTQSC